MACVIQTFVQAPLYLPEPSTSLAIVAIAVLMSMTQVWRLREVHLLRNLGVGLPVQAALGLAVAGSLELGARLAAVLLAPSGGAA